MARKLVDQDEAARILGISVEQLNLLRERQDVRALRDGGTWKYKTDDLDRYLQSRGEDSGLNLTSGSDEPLKLDDEMDSILLSEFELGQSSDTTSSTIIGKSGSRSSEDDDVQIAGNTPAGDGGSDVQLIADEGSDVRLVPGNSGVLSSGKNQSVELGGSDLALAGSDILGTDELSLEDDATAPIGSPAAAAQQHSDDEFELGMSDDDLVLGEDSDVTLTAGDSGISLVDPADSGLSLEDAPLELGGGSGIEMLELGEDDVIALEEDTDMESATQLKGEDAFLLTPADDGLRDETDSGSQVIALDSEDSFASAGGMFEEPGMPGMLEEDDAGIGSSTANAGLGVPVGLQSSAATPTMVTSSAPAISFSAPAVVALVCCALFLMLSGMMMFDLVRNIWSWGQPYEVNSTIMDKILELVG